MGEEIDLEKSQSSDSFSVKSTLFHQAAKLHGSHQDPSGMCFESCMLLCKMC